jgi:hypothetical protein
MNFVEPELSPGTCLPIHGDASQRKHLIGQNGGENQIADCLTLVGNLLGAAILLFLILVTLVLLR